MQDEAIFLPPAARLTLVGSRERPLPAVLHPRAMHVPGHDHVLVVSASDSAAARHVGRVLSAQRGWPLAEVYDGASFPRGPGAWRRILDTCLGRQPGFRYAGADPADFGLLVVVARPHWGHLDGAVRNFLHAQRGLAQERALVVAGGASAWAAGAERELAAAAGEAAIASLRLSDREIEGGACAHRLRRFAAGLADVFDEAG